MHYRSMREECWKIARATHAAYLQIHVTCPLRTAIERNNARDIHKRVPKEVIIRTAKVFEPPEYSTCVWDTWQSTIVLDGSDASFLPEKGIRLDCEEIWAGIWAAWGGPAPEVLDKEAEEERIAVARHATAEDLIHGVDVATRQILTATLSQLLTESKNQDKAKIAAALNSYRRDLLAQLRTQQTGSRPLDESHNNFILKEATTEAESAFSRKCDEMLIYYK